MVYILLFTDYLHFMHYNFKYKTHLIKKLQSHIFLSRNSCGIQIVQL